MNITRQDFDRQYKHIGNVRHGVQTGPWRVEFTAPVDETDSNVAAIKQGSVVSLTDNGKFIAGCADGSGTNRPVPFIAMKNLFDADVTTGIGGLATEVYTTVTPGTGTDTATTETLTATHGAPYRTYSAEGGKIVAIPLTCGYEMETTEFVPNSSYKVNDGLMAATGGDIGKVKIASGVPGTCAYLGFISVVPAAANLDAYGNQRLAFFANFIPKMS